MKSILDPGAYENWFRSPRGRWIGEREFILLQNLLNAMPAESLLDVGCGTGHFSRHFSQLGLSVTAIDPDPNALNFAQRQGGEVGYIQGDALKLPFSDNSFDYTIAVTSLCFINDPIQALREMWRVTRHTLVLGLLNRHSLLYRQKHGLGSYQGARWDSAEELLNAWIPMLTPSPLKTTVRSAIFFPYETTIAHQIEKWISNQLPWGGFLATGMNKSLHNFSDVVLPHNQYPLNQR